MEADLLKRSEEFAREVYARPEFEKYTYHNLSHTEAVVEAVGKIGEEAALTSREMHLARVAAWFHDVGYNEGPENHEQRSAEKAAIQLRAWGADEDTVHEVESAILATHMPQKPTSLIAKVLCDADLYHLSTDRCLAHNSSLRQESINLGIGKPEWEWHKTTLTFLKEHRYHTPYGRKVLDAGKKKNIRAFKKLLEGVKDSTTEHAADEVHRLVSEYLRLDRRSTLLLMVALLGMASAIAALLYLGILSITFASLAAFSLFALLSGGGCLRALQIVPRASSDTGEALSRLTSARSVRKELRRMAKQAEPGWINERKQEFRELVEKKRSYNRKATRLLLTGAVVGGTLQTLGLIYLWVT